MILPSGDIIGSNDGVAPNACFMNSMVLSAPFTTR